MPKEYYKRSFLNKQKGVASIEAKIQLWQGALSDATFKISDCYRAVSLDFNYTDEKSKQAAIYKVDKLVAELLAFKERLV